MDIAIIYNTCYNIAPSIDCDLVATIPVYLSFFLSSGVP